MAKKTTKRTPARKTTKKAKAKPKMSGLDAVAKVLAETKRPMTCGEMVEVALKKKYWATGGKTPAQTIYSAILREINLKKKDSRFKKAERGKFVLK